MTAILLPGWTCPCGVFNGEARATVELCRACAWRKPVDEKIRPSDVEAARDVCEIHCTCTPVRSGVRDEQLGRVPNPNCEMHARRVQPAYVTTDTKKETTT